MSSRALISEPPLLVLPSLATRIGLNQAIILQQLHWALGRRTAVEIDGVRWLKAELAWWEAQFPFWSEATIRRAIKDLTTAKLVKSKRGSEANVYAIDYAVLDALQIDATTGQDDQFSRERDDGGLKEMERQRHAATAAGPEPGTLFAPPSPVVPPSDDEVQIRAVWDYYFAKLGDKLTIKVLNDARKKVIRTALKAADGSVEILCKAMDGFIRYRSSRPGGYGISDIFRTGPNMSSMTERIEWLVSQADDSPTMSAAVPAAMRARVDRRRLQIVEALKLPDDSAAQERAREAVDWLRKNADEGPVIEDGKVVRWERIP